MKRNRLMAIILTGCMAFGNNAVLLKAEEQENLLFAEEEGIVHVLPDEDAEDIDIQDDAITGLESADEDTWILEEEIDKEIEDIDDAFSEDLIVDVEEMDILEEQIFYAEDADMTPPEIDLTTLKAEITGGKEAAIPGDTVTISVKATDDREIKYVLFNQFKPNGDTTGEFQMTYNDETGLYECTREITDNTYPGKYSAYYVRAIDTNSNITWLRYNEYDLSGGSYTVENANADVTPPEIDLTTLKAEITDGKEAAIPGDTVTISVKATDDREIKYVLFNQFKPNGDTTGEFQMTYNDETGLYEWTQEITDNTYPGEYSAYYVRAIDTNSNTTWLWYNEYDLSGGSYIVSGTTSDVMPPVIDTETVAVAVSGDKGFAVSGDVVNFSLAASDDGLGISRINVEYVKPVSGDKLCFHLTYNSGTGIWEQSIPFGGTMEGGLWKIYSIEALDKGGNLTRVVNAAFDAESVDDLSAGDFTVKSTVRFDTRGGSEISPQYVFPGEKATRPEDPTKGGGVWQGGGDFIGWYADEALTQAFNFNNPITEDTTVYAKWAYGFSISSYDGTNSADYAGGQYMVLQHGETEDDLYYGGSNYTLREGDTVTLKSYPDEGYGFTGWYKGEYIGMVDDDHTQVSRPLDMSDPDNLLTTDSEYTFTISQSTVICPVFEQLPRYDVILDSNNGSGEKQMLMNAYTGLSILACTFAAPENKHFAEWNTSADGSGKSYKENDPLELTESITLYAQWEDHSWTEGATVPATCTSEGSKTYTCTCGAERTDSIPVDPDAHQFAEAIRKAAPDADGLVYEKCSHCGKEQPVTPLPKANGYKLSASTFTYDGKAKQPSVTVTNSAGDVLAASNYTVSYKNNVNAGTATAVVTFKGEYYSGTKNLAFTIDKAANPMTAKGKTVNLKASKIKKKKQTVKAAKAFAVSNAQGTVTYKLISVKKSKFKKYFKISTKTGKITVKKKLKKGTYKVKVQVTASGNANYESTKKVVTVKVKIK